MKLTLKKGIQLGLYSLALATAACSQNAQDSPEGTAIEPAEQAEATSAAMDRSNGVDKSITELVNGAVTDLAAREGLAEADISVSRASLVTWGTSALGCPEPGMSYTEELVPGIWAVLAVGDAVHYYHGRLGADLFYCPKDRIQAPIKASKNDVM